jgi:hypothetical protein
MDKLSKITETVIERMFPGAEQDAVRSLLLDECIGKLPSVEPNGYERIHLAILKISNGDLKKFVKAAELARRDWRDVLIWMHTANGRENCAVSVRGR